MKRLPAIVSDIDGVLIRGKDKIPGSDLALKFLRQPLQSIMPDLPILNKNQTLNSKHLFQQNNKQESAQLFPFVCLTNGGGMLEQKKADQLNQYLGLQDTMKNINNNSNSNSNINSEEFQYFKLEKDDIILNYTPLRPILQQQYKNKPVLLIGTGDIKQMAQSMGLKKYITIEEYTSLYPQLVSSFERKRQNKFELRKQIQQRFGLRNQYSLTYPMQISGIMIINDPVNWEDSIQVMCDLLSSEDGKVLQRQANSSKMHIPIYTVNNDLTFSAKFHLERFAYGPFTLLFKEIFKMIFGYSPQIHEYGKPTKNTYQFTERYLRSKTPYQIENFYMIGDNPKSDIRGANQQGWTSILVRSGIFQGENDEIDPAHIVVEDFKEAIEFICDKEKINCDLLK